MAAMLAGALTSSANVTVQGWWHYGEVSDYYADSSGNGHRFGSAFSRVGSGNAGAGIMPFGCGGPLGTTGYTSTNCLYWTPTHANAAGMWGPGYNPPANNYVLECWCLPQWPGTLGGNGAWLFCSGSSGGVRFRLTNDTTAVAMTLLAEIVGNNTLIGDPLIADTNHWTHLAIVNTNGANVFYVNGVQHGAPSDPSLNTIPAGDIYGGSAPGTQPTYEGYLDELRLSTFAAGQFSTTDLLTRSMSPDILAQPQSANVWNGGAAPFTVGVAVDSSTTYQWRLGGANISGAMGSEYYRNTVGTGDSGDLFDVVLNNYTGAHVTSAVATLTVVPVQTDNVNAYRSAVTAEPSLVSYYTVDNDTGTTLTDTKGAKNGSLEGTASFDGRTTRSYGVRALRLKNTADGDVMIPNVPAFEFANGNGTIEAVVYLDQSLLTDNETIFSEAFDGASAVYYTLQASPDGSSLVYNNDSLTAPISWAIPTPILGRLAHVALAFQNNTVTAYVDGLSLGSKPHPSFGTTPGGNAYIGSVSLDAPGEWSGTIDELAIYSSALPANTIAIHNSKFLYGTNTAGPSITSQPSGSKTLLAGGAASFTVGASGTAPLTYQWTFGGAPISGATAATLTLANTTTSESGAYYVTVSNPYGSTNSQTFTLTFAAPTNRYAKVVMGDNPSAYWQLNETNGTTAFDVAGGNDGVYSGSVTLGGSTALPGIGGPAARFEGGNAQVPYSAALNPSGPFTIEFWANPDNEPSATYVPLCSQFRNGNGRAGWCIYDENDAASWEIHMGNASGVSRYAYGSGPEPFGGTWYHVVAVWDTTNTTMYAENELVGRDTQIANGGTYLPNPSAPLMIGVRNGGAYPFNGLINSVAIYNYAFSEQQISNHWSVKFQPSSIVTQPVGVTNVEGSTITLTAQAAGFPNTYQWYLGNTALAPIANADGTPHFSQDVTNASLTISETTPADSGLYHVVVLNPLPGGGSQSANAKVLITPDTNAPVVTSVQALATPNPNGPTPFLIKVTFNKRVDTTTASTTGNYVLSGGAKVGFVWFRGDMDAPAFGTDWKTAFLQTSGLTPGQKYTLSVSGVQSQTVAPVVMAPAQVSFWAPPLTAGVLAWDYYFKITPQAVSSLVNSPAYPYEPATNYYMTVFDTDQITGGDLNNNAAFGTTYGDNYGDSLSGWITPTVTGDYTFFITSDDASQLWLSTDATVANAAQIAEETGCCHGFLEPTNAPPQTSSPQHLVAGTPYFIRALHTEGGGGDYVKVAWRISTDSTPAAKLTPIPAEYLSAYVLTPPEFIAPVFANGQLTIGWNGLGTLLESSDLKTWTPVPGNPASPFVVTPSPTTPHLYYRLEQ